MKKTFIVILFLSSIAAFSQPLTINVLKKADASYSQFSYVKAVEYYKLALEKEKNSQYITNQIALSFRNLNEPDSAEIWFKKAINLGEQDPDFNFYLAEALLSNEKIEEAKNWYQLYNDKVDDDNRSKQKLVALDSFDKFFSNKNQVTFESIKANTPGLDFSPAFYQNGILFVSARPKSKWVTREFNWDASSFLDLYFVHDSSGNAHYYEGGLNTKYHEGPLVFYQEEKFVVYTRNNFDGSRLRKDEKGVTNLKLYFAEWDDKTKQWINEKPFQHNDDSFSMGSPAINEEGTILIFSSDIIGGFGSSDLYVSFKNESGWTKPSNLGIKVNSKGREGFPFLYHDILYFSSEGREGIGGLDIYQIPFDGDSVQGIAENLGAPFNSNRDDFGIIRKDKVGYFSSNREKHNSDDIYKFYMSEPQVVLISGDVYDIETNKPLPLADVFLKQKTGEIVNTRSTDMGKYQAFVPPNSSWALTAEKYSYELVSLIDIYAIKDSVLAERIYLKKIANSVEQQDSLETPNNTSVAKELKIARSFLDEFEVGDTIRIDDIYYDLDKSILRDESKKILTKVVNYMTEYVEVNVVLISHTDSRSNQAYNNALAERRSNAAESYLIAMGADPSKLSKQNLGESKLQNHCLDGEDCIEDLHQLNRRTEIIFIKVQEE